MNSKALLAVFLTESDELISDLEQGLLAIEANPNDEETIHRLFRSAHTLKSSAGMLGFEPMVALAHVTEGVLSRVRAHELAVTRELATLLLSSADRFRQMVAEVASGAAISVEQGGHQTLLAGLRKFVTPAGQVGTTSTATASVPESSRVYRISMAFRSDIVQTGQDPLLLVLELRRLGDVREVTAKLDGIPAFEAMDPLACYVSWTVVLCTGRPRQEIDSVFLFLAEDHDIRIADTTPSASVAVFAPAEKKIGELLVEAGCVGEKDVALALQQQRRLGEVLVEQGKISKESLDRVLAKQVAARKARQAATIRVDTEKLDKLVNLVGEMVIGIAQMNQTVRTASGSEAARTTAIESLEQIGRELQAQVMSVRMVPIGETFHRFKRAVRDLAGELGKHVVLETQGTETELDKIVIEQLADPLRHMIRNAVAHGIESPEERIRSGKNDTGRIALRAAQRQGYIIIEVADDGRGVDAERVLAKARRMGLAGDDTEMNEKQIFDFMFRPGFSTTEHADEISGRGVGLDVVQKNVQSLRGTIEVESTLGRGTTFRIKLPLTLAIIDGMHVQVGPKVLTIPLLSVVELISARPDEIQTVEGKGELVEVRGDYLPIVRLSEVLESLPREQFTRDSVVVVVEYEQRKFGVMVDRVLGMEQTVVKPLEQAFSLMRSLERDYAKPEAIAGATILGDGNVALILDVPGLERMAFEQVA